MLFRTTPRFLRLTAPPTLHLHPQPATLARSSRSVNFLRTSGRTTPPTRLFASSPRTAKGIQPDSEDPKPPNVHGAPVAGAATHVTEPTPLSPQEYYDYSEHYFSVLLGELERAQEEGSDVEAEYSVSDNPASFPSFPCLLPPHPGLLLSSSCNKSSLLIPTGRRPEHHRPRRRHVRA